MKRILLFALIIIVLPVMSRAQVFIAQFDAVNESDTLLCGVFGEADYGALQAIVDEYNGIISKQEQSRVRQENREMAPKYTSFEAAAQAAELDRQRKEAIRQLEKALSGEQLEAMKAEINKQFDQMIADLPGAYSDMSEALAEQDAMLGEYDPSEYSDELKYDVKRRIAELAVDGRLYNYNDARDFRHGRAAVGKKTYGEYGTPQWSWGFVDESARVVIPIIYRDVYDFNNREYRQDDVFETLEDTDSQGWTTVRLANDLMGMVDRDGNVKIPFRFSRTKQYQCIRFYETPWGEFAQVFDPDTELYGIIDRQGNYTLAPSHEQPIIWYTDILRFGYRTSDGTLITFDPYGQPVE